MAMGLGSLWNRVESATRMMIRAGLARLAKFFLFYRKKKELKENTAPKSRLNPTEKSLPRQCRNSPRANVA